jgi:hypothetical protein
MDISHICASVVAAHLCVCIKIKIDKKIKDCIFSDKKGSYINRKKRKSDRLILAGRP